jgi:hypothetical protein
MGRKPGPVKNTKVFRITPKADNQIDDILKYWQASSGFYNFKTYTRSDVVDQAIGQYWLQQRANHETKGKFCGICGQPKNQEE